MLVAQGILEHHGSLNSKSGFRDSEWNRKVWILCGSLSVSNIMSKISAVVHQDVMSTLGMDEIKMTDLERIPRVKLSDVGTAIYLIVGHNNDGRWALYVGSSDNVLKRSRAHLNQIRIARRDADDEDLRDRQQYCSLVLAEKGWNVTFHTLAVFDEAPYFVWKYIIETIFIILIGSMHKRAGIGQNHNEACCQLLDDMKHAVLKFVTSSPTRTNGPSQSPAPSATAIEPLPPKSPGEYDSRLTFLGLNRCLPIKQGFNANRAPSNRVCDQCSATTSHAWFFGPANTSYQAYICENCHRKPTRTSTDQAKLDAMKLLLLANPDLDECDHCGSTEGIMRPNAATGKILCEVDYSYWLRRGILRLEVTLWQELPTLDECRQCGSTQSLLRHLPTRSVLCLSCSDQYKGPENALIDNRTLKLLLPDLDECSNCGRTTRLQRCRATQSVLCKNCIGSYTRNGKLPEDQRLKESSGANRGALKRRLTDLSECSNCGSTANVGRHTKTQSVLCLYCRQYLRRTKKLPEKPSIKFRLPELDKCGNCGLTEGLRRNAATESVLCRHCYNYYERKRELPPPERSLKMANP